jgi:hypothetical protein
MAWLSVDGRLFPCNGNEVYEEGERGLASRRAPMEIAVVMVRFAGYCRIPGRTTAWRIEMRVGA